MSMWQKCPLCNGTGTIEPLSKVCTVCNGEKIINILTGRPPKSIEGFKKIDTIELKNSKNP